MQNKNVIHLFRFIHISALLTLLYTGVCYFFFIPVKTDVLAFALLLLGLFMSTFYIQRWVKDIWFGIEPNYEIELNCDLAYTLFHITTGFFMIYLAYILMYSKPYYYTMTSILCFIRVIILSIYIYHFDTYFV